MLLVIDVGNSNITCGVYNQGHLLKTFRLPSDINISQKEYTNLFEKELKGFIITDSIISTVVNILDLTIKETVDKMFDINSLIFDSQTGISINLKVDNPSQVGKDRVANAVAAVKYPLPAVVIDLGTATTFDIVDKDGDFVGGIIMPGINTQLKSLRDSTSLLPQITPKDINKVIGKNTEEAILSGTILGHASALEGLILKCEAELGESVYVIGTGGFAPLINKYMQNRPFDVIDSNLTLDGLREILTENKNRFVG